MITAPNFYKIIYTNATNSIEIDTDLREDPPWFDLRKIDIKLRNEIKREILEEYRLELIKTHFIE